MSWWGHHTWNNLKPKSLSALPCLPKKCHSPYCGLEQGVEGVP